MERLSFKRYFESKKKLLEACESVPRIRNEYKVTKYCKFPVFESLDDDSKSYVAFKAMDRIEVLWEKSDQDDNYPVARYIVLLSEDGQKVYPCWNNKKIHSWIENSTIEV
jgi:uncharacterized pyridoxamine 5'-phosphate oxidase family protein